MSLTCRTNTDVVSHGTLRNLIMKRSSTPERESKLQHAYQKRNCLISLVNSLNFSRHLLVEEGNFSRSHKAILLTFYSKQINKRMWNESDFLAMPRWTPVDVWFHLSVYERNLLEPIHRGDLFQSSHLLIGHIVEGGLWYGLSEAENTPLFPSSFAIGCTDCTERALYTRSRKPISIVVVGTARWSRSLTFLRGRKYRSERLRAWIQ